LTKQHRFDLLYSFGYPWSCHVVAHSIQARTGIPWIADYGDPWTSNPESSTYPAWRRKLDFSVESKLLRNTAAIVVATPETRAAFLSVFGEELRRRIYVAPVAQFHSAEYDAVPSILPPQFQLSFTGLYDPLRPPFAFYDAAEEFCGRTDLRICVAGLVGRTYSQYVESRQLGSLVRHLGRLGRKETVQLQRGSHVLLSFGWPGGMQIPCKLYEYFAARRPIFHIAGDAQDPATALVQQQRRGIAVPNDTTEIRKALQTFLLLWQRGKLDRAFDLSPAREFCLPRSLEGLERAVDHALRKEAPCPT
jgi:hypothetical protein